MAGSPVNIDHSAQFGKVYHMNIINKITKENRMNKTLHIVALCSLSAVLSSYADTKNVLAGSNLKIGFVDTFEVMRNCKSGKEATKDIQMQQETLAKELQEEQQRVAKAMSDFQGKGAALKPEIREKEEKKIVNMRRSLESKAQEYEEDLKITMQRISERIAKEVDEGVIAMAQASSFDAMVDKMTGRVIYTKAEFDVTEAVTKQVDKKANAPVAATKVTQTSVPAKTKNS